MSIHGNSQHLSQMVSQISRIYDFDHKVLEKRCGLSASLYGKTTKLTGMTRMATVNRLTVMLRITRMAGMTGITRITFKDGKG